MCTLLYMWWNLRYRSGISADIFCYRYDTLCYRYDTLCYHYATYCRQVLIISFLLQYKKVAPVWKKGGVKRKRAPTPSKPRKVAIIDDENSGSLYSPGNTGARRRSARIQGKVIKLYILIFIFWWEDILWRLCHPQDADTSNVLEDPGDDADESETYAHKKKLEKRPNEYGAIAGKNILIHKFMTM